MNGFDSGTFSDLLYLLQRQQQEQPEIREHFRLHLACNETYKASDNNQPFMVLLLWGLQSERQRNKVGYRYLNEQFSQGISY